MPNSNSFDRLQVFFFGAGAGLAEIHTLQDGGWTTEVIETTAHSRGGAASRIVGFEVENTSNLHAALQEALENLEKHAFDGCYFALPDRSSATLATRMIAERSFGRFDLYGVDPDYYYGLVPLTGQGHRQVESFVLRLKPAVGLQAKSKRLTKRVSIRLGLSARIYDSFVIILEGSSCS